jgi:hypothetical protein
MFKDELISSIENYWAMQNVDDLKMRVAMNRAVSRDPLVKAGLGVNVAGDPAFATAALAGQTEKFILARLGDYLVRDRIEAGLLVYVAATGDALARLAQAADNPDEWLVLAHRRINRFSADHMVCNRPAA